MYSFKLVASQFMTKGIPFEHNFSASSEIMGLSLADRYVKLFESLEWVQSFDLFYKPPGAEDDPNIDWKHVGNISLKRLCLTEFSSNEANNYELAFRAALKANEKISAIKAYRNWKGVGIKEAFAAIEDHMRVHS